MLKDAKQIKHQWFAFVLFRVLSRLNLFRLSYLERTVKTLTSRHKEKHKRHREVKNLCTSISSTVSAVIKVLFLTRIRDALFRLRFAACLSERLVNRNRGGRRRRNGGRRHRITTEMLR